MLELFKFSHGITVLAGYNVHGVEASAVEDVMRLQNVRGKDLTSFTFATNNPVKRCDRQLLKYANSANSVHGRTDRYCFFRRVTTNEFGVVTVGLR